MAGAGGRRARLRAEVAALEALDARRERGVRLDELDAELVEAEALQGLRALHVSIDLVEDVGDVVAPGAYRQASPAQRGSR